MKESILTINNCRQFISEIKRKPQNFYLVHYSCQNLNDNNEGLSPRITSIAITHYSTEQTVSFSTHSIAEELHISREDVRNRFDEVESKLIQDFFNFISDRRDKYWVHWNMRNLTYGFEHLEHRYRVLNGSNAPVIPIDLRINLNDLLADRYGKDYATHPQLISLMNMNGGRHRHFLTGKEEVQAFQNGEFMKMHSSTLCKIGFLHSVVSKLISGKLHTSSSGLGVGLDRLLESRFSKFVCLIGAIIGIVVTVIQICIWIK